MKSLKRRGFIKKSMVASAGLAVGAPHILKDLCRISRVK